LNIFYITDTRSEAQPALIGHSKSGVVMKAEELAAYIGAAAWMPQILTWIYRAITKPKLRIVPDAQAEVGFTTYGPIFNIRMAFFVENRDLIIDGLTLSITHADGDQHEMRWAGLGETFSEITDGKGNRQIVSKDQTPIAIKVNTQALFEKFVRFQESRFHAADGPTTRALVTHFNFLKQKSPDSFVQEVLNSKELFSVVDQRQKWFWWKPGRYVVSVRPNSPQKFDQVENSFAFELSDVDLDNLKGNIPYIDLELKNIINSNLPNPESHQFQWQWANIQISRESS
jgi:hypothetical protein